MAQPSYRRTANLGLGSWLSRDVTSSALTRWMECENISLSPSELIQLPAPDPEAFDNTESFRDAYWRCETWSKFPFDLGIDRKAVAYATFFDAERRCASANRDLADLWSRPIPERYRAVLSEARSLMAHLFRGFSLDEVVEKCGWGPGASTSMRRAQASPQNKWVLASHITRGALPYLTAFTRWCGRDFPPVTIVEGNKVTTVPKNAKTERVIAIEPEWNMFFQLGVGRAIRSRLRRTFGVLQPIGQKVNQHLARMGSASGDLATIDLKGASDSISLALVEALVPSDVLPHLLSLRSPHGVVDGERVTYEKISSMGNGFTFELETAIFYCLVRAASGHAMAYGDDLICHAHSYSFVCDVLAFCGFEVNAKKSFYRGPFRESCGGHYFKGVDVTPPYVRKPLVGPTRITVANRVSELSDNGYWRRSHLFRFHRELVRGIPRALWGPRDVPGVVHCGLYDAHPSYSKRYQSFTGTRVVEAPRRRDADPYGALLQSLWSHGDEDSWRETAFMKAPFRPVISFKRWWSHWPGVSPWAAEDC